MKTHIEISSKQKCLVFFVLMMPFILNDFGLIAFNGSNAAYLIDYTTRLLVLGLCLIWPSSRAIVREYHPVQFRYDLTVLALVALPIVGFLFQKLITKPIDKLMEFTILFKFHRIQEPVLYWFDLSFGLLLVAISEEIVFRKIAYSWLKNSGKSPTQIVLISSCLFAIVHWSNGLGNVISAFFIGLFYMVFYLKLKRLWPLILAHWFSNFIAFGSF